MHWCDDYDVDYGNDNEDANDNRFRFLDLHFSVVLPNGAMPGGQHPLV